MFTLETTATAAYVVAALLFILALAGLSKHETSRSGNTFGMAGMAVALIALSPTALQVHLTVFALAIVIGYYVIGNVHHALHTPLMSVTNAISGVILVGALLQVGHDEWIIRVLATVAILLASINVFGGFAVTRRMLGMFSKGGH